MAMRKDVHDRWLVHEWLSAISRRYANSSVPIHVMAIYIHPAYFLACFRESAEAGLGAYTQHDYPVLPDPSVARGQHSVVTANRWD